MNSQQPTAPNTPATGSPDYFKVILNNIEESFILLNKDLVIIESNRAAQTGIWKQAGMQLLPGKNIMESIDERRRPLLQKFFAEVLKGQTRKTEYAYTAPDGTFMHFENNLLPAWDEKNQIFGIVIYSKDITEKKKAEIAIKEAEERWQFALDAADQAAWDWHIPTNEVIYSSSYKKMYGFVDGDLKNDINEWKSRIHPDDQKRLDDDLDQHFKSANPYYETTYRIRLKSGEFKWIMARGKIIARDAEGKPVRMIGTHTDLTSAIEAKESLRKMNERFFYAAKACSQALWEWDAITGEAYVSPSFTEMFGWEADADRHFDQWHEYVHPDDKKTIVEGYYNALKDPEQNIWQATYRFEKADGSYAIVSDKAYILRDEDGSVTKVIGATEDVTAAKKIEEELLRSNGRFDIIMKATNELLWEWDIPNNIIHRAPQGLKKVYGIADDSGIKSLEDWLQRIHPDDHKIIDGIIDDLLKASHQQTFEIEYRFKDDEGNYIHVYDRGILLKDENNRPLRMIGAAQNISRRKQLEQELLQNELEYKKLINQATVDSQEQERGEIGRELHDNINQVLTTTKLYLELALANDDMIKELVKKSSKNISSVINEIRQLSRSLMDPTIGDLGIIDSVEDLVDNINLTQKIQINVDIAPDIEHTLDKNQKLTVFRIIQESLNNVIKHATATFVKIYITRRQENIELRIEDDGIGFVVESVKKGAGLKNITNRVYLINGSFAIDSGPGKGSRIRINFPIQKPINTE